MRAQKENRQKTAALLDIGRETEDGRRKTFKKGGLKHTQDILSLDSYSVAVFFILLKNISLILSFKSPKHYLNMRKLLYILLALLVTNCGTVKKKTSYSKNKDYSKTRKVTVEASETGTKNTAETTRRKNSKNASVTDDIISTALGFSGTRYKYGGTTKKGMDCSGLLYVSFGEHDVQLPRVSYHMAEEGKRVRIKNVEKGDLLFFKTSKRSKRINHVGMVVAVEDNEVKFIHASSSRGVIVSSLREGYWNYAFVKATRVL